MTSELRWHLTATDSASKAFSSIAASIDSANAAMSRNVESVAGATEAEKRLEEAYKRFPMIHDQSVASLKSLADAQSAKNGVDRTEILDLESKLAAYKVTGSEIQKLVPEITALSVAEGSTLTEAMDKVTEGTKKQSAAMSTLHRGAALLAGVVSVSAVSGFAKQSVKAFEDGEKAENDLELAYKRFPAVADVNIDKMKALADQIETTAGYSHDEVEDAEARLAMYGLTGQQIQKLTPLVADFAARQGIDLVEATTEVGRAMEGQARSLQTIGVHLPNATAQQTQLTHAENATAAATAKYQASLQKLSDLQAVDSAKKKIAVADTVRLHDATLAVAAAKEKLSQATAKETALSEGQARSGGRVGVIMDALKEKIGGYADAQGKTAAGQTKILTAEFNHLQETMGSVLVPVIKAVIGVLVPFMGFLAKNPALVQAIAVALGILTIAIVGATIAQTAFSAALWASGIPEIIIGVTLLVVAIIFLATHWSQVTAFIAGLWQKFVDWIVGVINGFVSWWNGLWAGFAQWIVNEWDLFIKGIQILWNDLLVWVYRVVVGFQSWWNGIWTSVGNFLSMIWNVYIVGATRQVFNWLVSTIGGALNWIVSTWNNAWSGLGSIVKSIFHGIVSFVLGGVNMVIGAINGLISLADKVPGVSIPQLAPVKIPGYASGIDSAPGGLSIVGENGPELMNVPAGSSITPNGRTAVVALDEPTIRTLANYLAQAIVPGVQYHSENIAGAVVSAAFGG